ncbi:helix-turn-helix domain-containing protein [Shewanella sairae]|nr:helix-turn-helix domain-containing protein [Shewanella sairae]MCL1129532.1 helix-turn-helix domain-containing protein [Shewanella sairae]
MKTYSAEEILALSRAEKEPRKRMRLLAVALFREGNSRTEAALRLKVARASVNAWVAKYLANGVKDSMPKRIKAVIAI